MHNSVLIGLAILCAYFFVARKYEGQWIPPSAILMVVMYFHGILAPLVYDSEGAIKYSNLNLVLDYALIAQMALLLGYILVGSGILVAKQSTSASNQPSLLLNKTGFKQTIVLVFLLSVYGLAFNYLSGGLDVGKGTFAYEQEGGLLYRIATMSLIIPTLVLALTMSVPFHEKGSFRYKSRLYLLILIFGFLLLGSLLQFERGQIAKTIVLASIFYHYRVRAFTFRNITLLSILFVILQAFSSLRTFGVGVTTLSGKDVMSVLFGEHNFFLSLVTAIPGQEVLAEVIDIVPSMDSYKYGETYLDSIIGLFLPRVLGLSDYSAINTPAYWFKDIFARGVTGHGFDFSLLSEAYLNFGAIGIFLVPLLIGGIVFVLSRNIRQSNSGLTIFFCITTLISIIFSLRSDSNTLFKAILYLFLPVFLIVKSQDGFGLLNKLGLRASQSGKLPPSSRNTSL